MAGDGETLCFDPFSDGLPPEGRCPECGTAYDGSAIILHGWYAGWYGPMILQARGRNQLKAILLWALWTPLIALKTTGWWRLSALTPLAMAGVLVCLSRRGPDDVPPMQLRIGRDGLCCRTHPVYWGQAGIQQIGWTVVVIGQAIITLGIGGSYSLAPLFAMLTVAALIGLLFILQRVRRRTPRPAGIDRPVAWKDIGKISFRRRADGLALLQVRRGGWIGVLLQLSDEQHHALREVLHSRAPQAAWREEKRGRDSI